MHARFLYVGRRGVFTGPLIRDRSKASAIAPTTAGVNRLGFRLPVARRRRFHTTNGSEGGDRRRRTKMSGSAFSAFKSLVPVAWSPRLYITLVRGLPGTRRLHRRTLEAMRLRRCHRTVEHRTTPSLLGMLTQVKRLVVVETEEMYNARRKAEEERRAPRPPLVVSHHPPAPTPKPAAAEAAATSQ